MAAQQRRTRQNAANTAPPMVKKLSAAEWDAAFHALEEDGTFEVVAVADPSEHGAGIATARGVRHYADTEEMLRAPPPPWPPRPSRPPPRRPGHSRG